jgi:Transposase, Mutator family
MTDDRMALIELIEKSADADLVREMLAYAADRLMALEVEGLTGAPLGARSTDRVNHRNGYRERAGSVPGRRGWRGRAIPLPRWCSPGGHGTTALIARNDFASALASLQTPPCGIGLVPSSLIRRTSFE